jgi:hypothetical protein
MPTASRRKTAGSGRRAPAEAVARGFARLTLLPVIGLIAWLIPGLPLLLAGDFAPVPMLLIAAPLAAALAVNTLHRVPERWPPERVTSDQVTPERTWEPMAGLAGTLAVSASFVVWQLALAAPSVLVTRTPGVMFQAGYWIAQHGSLPIPGSLAAFGGPVAGLHASSAGFFPSGGSVVPGVLAGLPMLLSAGFWTSGMGGGAVVGPVLGGLAVLSFGGLVGRLAGPRWAPVGALALAVTLPELYVSRDAFAEPAVQVLLFGGMSLVVDALTLRLSGPSGAIKEAESEPASDPASDPASTASSTAPSTARKGAAWQRLLRQLLRQLRAKTAAMLTPERMLAGLGGLALGLASLLSPGSLVYLVPAVVAGGVIVAVRRDAGTAFGIGLAIGCGYGLLAGYVLARPLMDARARTLTVIGLDAAAWAALVGCVIALRRVRRVRAAVRAALQRRPLRWLPEFGAVVVVVAVAGLLARPYLQTVRGALGPAETHFVSLLQRSAGLRVDPARLYSEDTGYWVIWYAGLPALLLGGFAAAVVLRRCLRSALRRTDASGEALNWALPLAVGLGGSAAVLWQPFTVPDQPWASRRLVPVVLPAVILLATWAAAWLVRLARNRGAGQLTGAAVGALCLAAMVLPSLSTSFGVGLTHSGVAGGLRTSSGGLAQHAVGSGQTQAVRGLCAAIGRSSSVLIVDQRVAQVFAPVIRGECGLPVAWVARGAPVATVRAALIGITRAGRHPVVLGATVGQVDLYGGTPVRLLRLVTTQEPHVLTQPPGAPRPAVYQIWMVAAFTTGAGI